MQVVNGGQTTASLFFSQRKHPNEIDLGRVRVPAKIIVLNTSDAVAEEEFVANISKYANSQNNVKQSDLSANKRFHREVENLASTTICPDGIGRWFYERAAGSYKTMLARDGMTPARLRKLRQATPPARKFTKTDLAKYLNAWEQLPHVVSLGAQKNFVMFMERMTTADDRSAGQSVDLTEFKRMIAKAIIYRTTQRMTRGRFPAFQANVVTYTVAVVACRARRETRPRQGVVATGAFARASQPDHDLGRKGACGASSHCERANGLGMGQEGRLLGRGSLGDVYGECR